MGWKCNEQMNLRDNTKVRYLATEGVVDAHNYITPSGYVAVLFEGEDCVCYVHWGAIEVFEPDPPTKQYEPSDYFQHIESGALYKKQFSGMRWHLICVGQLRPSIDLTSCDSSIPSGFKRLYKEV